jgi:isoleucyl-tRNA synthetase
MTDLPERVDFPAEEERVQELWGRLDAFKTSLKLSAGKPEYTFYDGPPFATGLPHYGHILAGTIKDIVTRYATQTGHYVSRRFGWDCHGLPVEYEIDKKLDIKGREQVLAMGIDKYNAECRSIVTRYCGEWEAVVTRLGRWIDFRNDYKTMEPWYMESVWWVFKELWGKSLVYRSFKVMPYSTACNTPLSNFEANLNYKDETVDPAVVVAFPLAGDADGASLVAWTTTPWTLPSNLALCVHPALTYAKVRDAKSGAVYVLAAARLVQLFPKYKAPKPAAAAEGA